MTIIKDKKHLVDYFKTMKNIELSVRPNNQTGKMRQSVRVALLNQLIELFESDNVVFSPSDK